MIRVAMVGCGGMARHYRKVYASLEGVEFTLAVDVNESELQACKALGVKRVSARFEDALAADIDVVDISTPNHMHEPQAVAALAAGKHVLLQKPMANSVAAADKIVAAAQKARGTLGMFMSSLCEPVMWDIKTIMEQGLLGNIQSVRARDAHRGGLSASADASNWRGDREKTGGGCFVQLSIHSINLMQWWLGSRITEVFAYSQNQYCPRIGGDDVTTAVAKFTAGPYAVFESGWASEGQAREIFGTQGTMRLTNNDCTIELQLNAPFHGKVVHYDKPGAYVTLQVPGITLEDASNPLSQQRMFIERVKAGQPPVMSGSAGRQDLAVTAAAYESARLGKPVAVE